MFTIEIFGALTVAFVVTSVFITVLRPIAIAVGLVDKPGGRKLHVGDVPIIGGLAMFAGMFSALILVPNAVYLFPPLFVSTAILVIVGVVDDRFSITPSVRMTAQIAVVLIMYFGAGLSLTSIGNPFGTGELHLGPATLIVTLLVALTMINAYNLVDGIDGLAGSLALVAMLAIGVVTGFGHVAFTVSLIMAAAVVAFLIFNFPTIRNRRMRCFMGDAGSTMLGFAIVWVTLGVSQGSERVISPVLCLWFASVPIYDLMTCFVRRLLQGKSPFTPGRDHFHHALNRGGFGVRETLGILTGLQTVYAVIALIGHFSEVPEFIMFAGWSALGLTQRWVIKRIARSRRGYLIKSQRQ